MMNTGKAFFYSDNTARHTTKSEFSLDGLTVANLPRVEVVYSYANLNGDIVDAIVAKGVKGLVLAGVDYGEVPGLSNEVRAKLIAARPWTVGQAGRIDGMTPAALGILAAYLRREGRRKNLKATG